MTEQQIKIINLFSKHLGIDIINYDARYDYIMSSCPMDYRQFDCPSLCIPPDKMPIEGVTKDICHKCWLIALEQKEEG